MGVAGEFPVKGLMINMATTFLFSTPMLLYWGWFDVASVMWTNLGVWAVAAATPPWGWKKPHPYSDQAHLRQASAVDRRSKGWFVLAFVLASCNAQYALFGRGAGEALAGSAWAMASAKAAFSGGMRLAQFKAGIRSPDATVEYAAGRAMDVFEPKNDKKKTVPACVYFHAGAFVFGHKGWGAGALQLLADQGVKGFSVGYRLASDPLSDGIADAVEDARAALRHVVDRADHYGVDPNRIFVMGDSAGGLLAATLALDAGPPSVAAAVLDWPLTVLDGQDWFGAGPLEKTQTPSVFLPSRVPTHKAAAFLNDHVLAGSFLLFGKRARGWLPTRYDPTLADLYSPAARLSEWRRTKKNKLPPLFVTAAVNDTIVPYGQSRDFAARYSAAGGDATLVAFADADHGQGGAYDSPAGRQSLFAFLDKHRLLPRWRQDQSNPTFHYDSLDTFSTLIHPRHLSFPASGRLWSAARRASILVLLEPNSTSVTTTSLASSS